MVDVVYGQVALSDAAKRLVQVVSDQNLDGTLYIGYPILTSANGAVEIDAMLISQQTGLLAFDLSNLAASNAEEDEHVVDLQDRLFAAITSKLSEEPQLVRRRQLQVPIQIVTISEESSSSFEETHIKTTDDIAHYIAGLTGIDQSKFEILNSVIERATILRPKKNRSSVQRVDSKGQKLKVIESKIANLDASQKKAAIEFPDGPQRIRGLAGSGKTIVLAMKASFLHLKNPEWRIAFTFYTRSLYQQLKGLVRRFSFEFIKDEPDWDKLKVLHAWGSSYTWGLYAEMARAASATIHDFRYASKKYGFEGAFEGVCRELLEHIHKHNIEVHPIYDVVLIDEAQDIPQPFFELVYKFTTPPHRIVYAYDELQTLNEIEMLSPEDLFGKDRQGQPNVKIENKPNSPRQDIILPVCYRNNQWSLTTAHGLGFGTAREKGLVQMFENTNIWQDIGYEVSGGSLQLGHPVSLKRSSSATPSFFSDLLSSESSVRFQRYSTPDEEYAAVANAIRKNLNEDELEHDDILVIVCDTRSIRSSGAAIMRHLSALSVNSHIVGVTESADEVFSSTSVAITHVYRAKGNEAPMVYVVGADFCYSGVNLGTLRNILFTSITRSRAWVQVTGQSDRMDALVNEYQQIKQDEFQLSFTYPSARQLRQLRTLHRDLTAEEVNTYKNDLAGLARVATMLQEGRISIDDLPDDVRAILQGIGNA
ncbi:DEAD/DEAH box helicase [Pseudovibrio ascidiaceicola]|uniref:DEAD/DEAH box helicase n=1 Tax=Pseudovibrio ascidiaceicola TaxID=285279 RepID=UPI000D68E8BF|nr:ATP-binding domain-containing protein [Pseudovibrio ascidiaceicola]